MQIVVLGMRSGSSVITRLINLFGVSVGPAHQLMEPKNQNEKGFWESETVMKLNNALLSDQGCVWNRASSFDRSVLASDHLDGQRQEAARIIMELDASRPWVLKEPRICLTLPFWLPFLEVPIFVYIYRHPLEVAHSLRTHHHMPLPCGLALWELYTLEPLRHTQGAKRCAVSYNQLMQSPVDTVKKLYDQLIAFGVHRIDLPNEEEIRAFIDPALYREKIRDPGEETLVSVNQQKLYEALMDGAIFAWETIPELPLMSRELLAAHDDLHRCREVEKALRKQLAAQKTDSAEKMAGLQRQLNEKEVAVGGGTSFRKWFWRSRRRETTDALERRLSRLEKRLEEDNS